MRPRHEIPTHLEVADRALLGLTMRQLLQAAAGLALAYACASDLPLPLPMRLAAAAAVLALAALAVLWRPGGRPLDEWAVVLLRYASAPRVATWRPRAREEGPAIREVLLPETPRRGPGRGGGRIACARDVGAARRRACRNCSRSRRPSATPSGSGTARSARCSRPPPSTSR